MPASVERRGGRPKARDLVVRVLYEADITGDDPDTILELALGRFHLTESGRRLAVALVAAFCGHRRRIDNRISARLENWVLARVGAVERAILRMATAEVLYEPETPAQVILDEALRLAHRYSDPDGVRFVNGVLDPVARETRPRECAPQPASAVARERPSGPRHRKPEH